MDSFQFGEASPAAEGDARGDKAGETEVTGVRGMSVNLDEVTVGRDAASLADERRAPSFAGESGTFNFSLRSAVVAGGGVKGEGWGRALLIVEGGAVFRILLGREETSEVGVDSEEVEAVGTLSSFSSLRGRLRLLRSTTGACGVGGAAASLYLTTLQPILSVDAENGSADLLY